MSKTDSDEPRGTSRSQSGKGDSISKQGFVDSANSFEAACARTLTRGLALYFSRPVRLFRPAKVTGWQFLKNIAHQEGAPLTPAYVISLCRAQGVWVVPKHFLPPILLNAALGTVLWTSYGEVYDWLSPRIGHHPIAAATLAGAFAGGCQALVAAPAENVRLLLEGGSGGHSWSYAWKEVFQSRALPKSATLHQEIEEIRELRTWLKDVGEMAGRGWNGWRWGCAKDVCAFGAFFAVFEVTRRTSLYVKTRTQELCQHSHLSAKQVKTVPKILNAFTLVTGGVLAGLVYEAVCRPWDRIRRIIHVHRSDNAHAHRSIPSILRQAVHEGGLMTFFVDPIPPALHHGSSSSTWAARLARTFARVGPWGVGFLVWETYGSNSN